MQARLQEWFTRNIWNPEFRGVNLEDPRTPIGGWQLDQILGGGVSRSGKPVGYNASLSISAVWRASSIRSGFLSSLPFKLYRKTDSGRVEVKASEHPLALLFSRKPSPAMTKVVYLDRSMSHFDFWGNHYARIKQNGIGRTVGFDLLHPKDVQVFQENGIVAYKVKGETVSADQIIHVPNLGDEIKGKAVITYAAEDLGMQMDTREYGVNFYGKGGRVQGVLEPQYKVQDPEREKLTEVWTKSKKRGGDVALPFGWKYQAIGIPPDQAAFLASNEFGITTIARWFGIPSHKLADMGQATYSNIEHMGIEFIQDTMAPIAAKFEAEYTTKCLTLPNEADMYLEFNLDAYLRSDSVAKAQLFSTYVQNGLKKPNEIRRLNNDPDDPYGDDLMMQSGTVPLRLIDQMLKSKQPAPAPKRQIRYTLEEAKELLAVTHNGNGNGKH